MKIYCVIRYTYSGCDNDVTIYTEGAFKTRELAVGFMKKRSRKYYEEWFDQDEYKYEDRDRFCEITNGEFVDWDGYNLWYCIFEVKECDFFDADLIIQNN